MKINSHPLADLPGLNTTHGKQLTKLGLTTTGQLYHYGTSLPNRQNLAKALSVPLRYVTKWVVLADLARVPSVGCEFCGALLHTGIASVEQLAACSPQTLYTQIRRLHVSTMSRSDLCPTPDQIKSWIYEARVIAAHSP